MGNEASCARIDAALCSVMYAHLCSASKSMFTNPRGESEIRSNYIPKGAVVAVEAPEAVTVWNGSTPHITSRRHLECCLFCSNVDTRSKARPSFDWSRHLVAGSTDAVGGATMVLIADKGAWEPQEA